MAKSTGVTAKNESVTEFLKRKAAAGSTEFDLPSGLKCRVKYFSGKDAVMLTKIADGREELATGALINVCCEFSTDGEVWSKLIPDEAEELLHGADFVAVMEKLQGTSSEAGK
jgi:hypothetical protein